MCSSAASATGLCSWMGEPSRGLGSRPNVLLCNKIDIKSSWYVHLASFALAEHTSAGSCVSVVGGNSESLLESGPFLQRQCRRLMLRVEMEMANAPYLKLLLAPEGRIKTTADL